MGRADRWIRWTTTGSVGLLALIAATVSYLHMLVASHEQLGWVAALTPFSVDGMIVVASTTLLAGRDLQRQAWQWALVNRGSDGALPSGSQIARQHGRRERWGRLVKSAGMAGEFTASNVSSLLWLRRGARPPGHTERGRPARRYLLPLWTLPCVDVANGKHWMRQLAKGALRNEVRARRFSASVSSGFANASGDWIKRSSAKCSLFGVMG